MRSRIYINGAEQISIQEPLCENWMDKPVAYDTKYAKSIDPDFKPFISPIEARRMGKILKRAIATTATLLKKSGIEKPDAIITGTGYGCIDNSLLFLDALTNEGEQLLKPTHFMQSTHNTISSLLAIQTKNHGYNVTYSHKGISFDSALFDAYMQFLLGKIGSAVVGSFDEVSQRFFMILEKGGILGGSSKGIAGEAAVSIMLSNNPEGALCELASMRLLYKPSIEKFKETIDAMAEEAGIGCDQIDAVMTGVNGESNNDNIYAEFLANTLEDATLLRYKHIFGESYSASGIGMYAAAQCLSRQAIPEHIKYERDMLRSKARNILVMNHSEGKNFTLTLMKEHACGR